MCAGHLDEASLLMIMVACTLLGAYAIKIQFSFSASRKRQALDGSPSSSAHRTAGTNSGQAGQVQGLTGIVRIGLDVAGVASGT